MSRLEEIRRRMREQEFVRDNRTTPNAGANQNIVGNSFRNSDNEETAKSLRKAIIFGNNNYGGADTLSECHNDANSINEFFHGAKYLCSLYLDASSEQMNLGFSRLENSIAEGDEVVIYFSGHGFQLNSEQFLVPIGIKPQFGETKLEVLYRSVNINEKIDSIMKQGARMVLSIIDACRPQYRLDIVNNTLSYDDYKGNMWCEPAFPLEEKEFLSKSKSKNQVSKFLKHKDSPRVADIDAAGVGMFFSTSHNTNAYDGCFTDLFVKVASSKGRTISEILQIVRKKVIDQSGGKQSPAFYDNLNGDFYFYPP